MKSREADLWLGPTLNKFYSAYPALRKFGDTAS